MNLSRRSFIASAVAFFGSFAFFRKPKRHVLGNYHLKWCDSNEECNVITFTFFQRDVDISVGDVVVIEEDKAIWRDYNINDLAIATGVRGEYRVIKRVHDKNIWGYPLEVAKAERVS